MEILIGVAAKAAEYAVVPIKHGATKIFYPQTMIHETRNEYNQLQEKHNQVKDQCQQAVVSDGGEIIEEVKQWLTAAQAILIEVGKWLQEYETNTTNTCTKFCANKWVWAHKERKNAKRKKADLSKMFEQGSMLSRISRLPSVKGKHLLSSDDFIVYKSITISFNDTMRALKRNDQRMVGVYGMGGVGKTSLVTTAITAAEDEQLFSKVVVSVVSQAPNVHKIQADLAEQLCLKYSMETDLGRATQLRNRIKLEETILVVLDDVWKYIDLTSIGIPYGDDHTGCKVLFTTRLERVCKDMGCEQQIGLSPLEDEESWDLFKIHAGTPPSQLELVARNITRECNGLPLALVVVGRALQDKREADWNIALKQLESSRLVEIGDIDPDRNVYEKIKLSYDFLTGEKIKKCFLMCALFPEDYEISVETLTKYVWGCGLFEQDLSIDSYMLARDNVEIMINRLLEYSLLLLKKDGMTNCIKMHDMVRDAALWITSTGEEIFLVPIPSHNWTRDSKLVNAMAISLLACPMNQHLPNPAECSRLKMLLLAQRKPLPNVSDTCFDRMTTLRVLDMTSIASNLLELVLPSSLGCLSNLRTLYLRRWILTGNMSIIGRLTTLEILSLAGSVIDELPEELVELSELKFLDLSACTARASLDTPVLNQLVLRVEDFCPPNKPISDLIYDKD